MEMAPGHPATKKKLKLGLGWAMDQEMETWQPSRLRPSSPCIMKYSSAAASANILSTNSKLLKAQLTLGIIAEDPPPKSMLKHSPKTKIKWCLSSFVLHLKQNPKYVNALNGSIRPTVCCHYQREMSKKIYEMRFWQWSPTLCVQRNSAWFHFIF